MFVKAHSADNSGMVGGAIKQYTNSALRAMQFKVADCPKDQKIKDFGNDTTGSARLEQIFHPLEIRYRCGDNAAGFAALDPCRG
jgi:hypothetical protein